ncbi:MAG: hypothetical protein ACXWQE_09525 [Bdellovibrionales bacterium]
MFRILCMIFVLSGTLGAIESFWPGKTMSTDQVEKKWGTSAFVAEKFREGDVQTRASMAAALLKDQKQFLGKSFSEIKSVLGPHDGHYFNDSIPAYFIQIGKNKSEESWQIVFLPAKDRKVSKIIVHKNCCI